MKTYWYTENEHLWNVDPITVGDAVYYDLSEARALGDCICSTPTLRKIYEAYGQKINVVSNFPEIFKKNPYVDKNYPAKSMNMDYIRDNFIVHNSFYNIGRQSDKGVQDKHNHIDIRQFHAIKLGFQLEPDQLYCEYYADDFEPIEGLPDKFVLIHPVENWESRTWSAANWMRLTKELNDRGIAVVSIGKDSSEVGFWNIDKPVLNFEIPLGLNLMNKTNVSQAWHIISKATCFVTMDSGLLHLAGTTDSHIIQLGSSINPLWRAPYRNNSQSYKYDYVLGTCDLFCASKMKYGIEEWGSIQGVPPLIKCLENKPTFECHPSVDKVLNKVLEIYE